jgi:hypothetical protein
MVLSILIFLLLIVVVDGLRWPHLAKDLGVLAKIEVGTMTSPLPGKKRVSRKKVDNDMLVDIFGSSASGVIKK